MAAGTLDEAANGPNHEINNSLAERVGNLRQAQV